MRLVRGAAAGILTAVWLLALAGTPLHASDVRVLDLDGRPADPFQAPAATKALVFLFVSVDCPISNRYAPDVRRLFEKYPAKDVRFALVYPNPHEGSADIQRHLKDYSYPMRALRDPQHELVKLAQATITPEAAVFDPSGRLLYHGRIDDRYVSLGLERPAATRRDLDEVLTDIVAGRPPRQASTQAVGCFIADFVW